ncbi:MAG: ribosome maturation factor RimM [Candidatus Obscuribacterales bacterium]|nr:ribosome maturation factor RimM [Candidatus Obscuribacterales bacterium]
MGEHTGPADASTPPAAGKNFLVGRIVGFHGLSGEVKVRPATNNPELLLSVTSMRTGNTPHFPSVDLEVDSLVFDKRMLYVCFKGFEDRTSVEHLEGADLFAAEAELEPLEEEEFWVKDLVGLEVFTTEGKLVGRVVDIIYGGNDILEIKGADHPPEKSILIPFVKSLVPAVDLKAKRVEIVDVPGLLEAQ